MCLYSVDNYSNGILELEKDIEKCSNRSFIREMVVGLVSTIEPGAPPRPDMTDPYVFKFYFLKNNVEYKYYSFF
jgi:hypothetical protein